MIKTKKGDLPVVFASVIILIFFGFFFLFITNFMVEVGESYIIEDVHNISLAYAQQNNLSNTSITIVNEARTNYTETVQDVPYDLYFLIAIMTLFMSNVATSFASRKYGIFSFFGLSTVGVMFFVALISFLEQVRLWMMNNFFYAIFGTPTISTPFIDWFNSNIPFIGFIWIIIMILINQIDINTLNGNRGRFEE